MARALDRVKAAEAKYEAMAATAEKLEATLKELKSTAKSCQWSIDELRRVADRERGKREHGFLDVCVDGRDHGRGWGSPWEFLSGDCRANNWGARDLVGKLMPSRNPALTNLILGRVRQVQTQSQQRCPRPLQFTALVLPPALRGAGGGSLVTSRRINLSTFSAVDRWLSAPLLPQQV